MTWHHLQHESHLTFPRCQMRFSSTGENGRKPGLICKNTYYAFPTKISNISQYHNNFFHSFICNHSSFITLYMYPFLVKTEIDFWDRRGKINVPETDLLRYWPMLEIFSRKVLDVDCILFNLMINLSVSILSMYKYIVEKL